MRAGTTELFQGVQSCTQTTELVENVGAPGIPTIELFQEAKIAVNGGLQAAGRGKTDIQTRQLCMKYGFVNTNFMEGVLLLARALPPV